MHICVKYMSKILNTAIFFVIFFTSLVIAAPGAISRSVSYIETVNVLISSRTLRTINPISDLVERCWLLIDIETAIYIIWNLNERGNCQLMCIMWTLGRATGGAI